MWCVLKGFGPKERDGRRWSALLPRQGWGRVGGGTEWAEKRVLMSGFFLVSLSRTEQLN